MDVHDADIARRKPEDHGIGLRVDALRIERGHAFAGRFHHFRVLAHMPGQVRPGGRARDVAHVAIDAAAEE
jgi:hypothetical protein